MGKKEGDLVPGGEGMVVVVALNGKGQWDFTRALLRPPLVGWCVDTHLSIH